MNALLVPIKILLEALLAKNALHHTIATIITEQQSLSCVLSVRIVRNHHRHLINISVPLELLVIVWVYQV